MIRGSRVCLGALRGPTPFIWILVLILFISLSRHYVSMKQSSNGTKGYSGRFRSSASQLPRHPSPRENAATSLQGFISELLSARWPDAPI